MTPNDRDLEDELEDWLEDQARPMPQQILESALEAVSRTTQVGRRWRLGSPWLGPRSLAVAAVVAVLILIVVGGPTILANLAGFFGPQPGAGPSEPPAEGAAWDPVTDYRTAPDQVNPSPDRDGNPAVWSYMRSAEGRHTPDGYFLLPNFDVESASWYERDFINLRVGYSMTNDAIDLHGWSDGTHANNRFAILAWRSPLSGRFNLAGAAWSPSTSCPSPADGIDVFVDQDGESLETFHVGLGETRSFDITTAVEAGQSLYFINDPGTDANCDTLLLRLVIRQVDQP